MSHLLNIRGALTISGIAHYEPSSTSILFRMLSTLDLDADKTGKEKNKCFIGRDSFEIVKNWFTGFEELKKVKKKQP